MEPTQQELIWKIMAEGNRIVIASESVPLDQFRPLIVHYTSSLGTAVETWEYVPGNQWQPDWGAIRGVYYSYIPPDTGSVYL